MFETKAQECVGTTAGYATYVYTRCRRPGCGRGTLLLWWCSPKVLQPLFSESLILVISQCHHLLQGKESFLLHPKQGAGQGWGKGWDRQGEGGIDTMKSHAFAACVCMFT